LPGRHGHGPGGSDEPTQRGAPKAHVVEDVDDQSGQATAVFDDDLAQFRPKWMVWPDAQIAADVGNDGADGLALNQISDLLRSGQARRDGSGLVGLTWPVFPCPWIAGLGWAGARWAAVCDRPWLAPCVEVSRVTDDPRLERFRAQQTASDAGDDGRDIAVVGLAWVGLERTGELPAVVYEAAHEAEEARDSAWLRSNGGWRIRHRRSKGHRTAVRVKEIFPTEG